MTRIGYRQTPEHRAKASAGMKGHRNALRHGHATAGALSPTYRSWRNMLAHCRSRGITVCKRWAGRDGFVHFLAIMGERPEGMTLDRIDHDGPYAPGNCRWATRSERKANKRARGNPLGGPN